MDAVWDKEVKDKSLPSRECGLKSKMTMSGLANYKSLPSRECGLKFDLEQMILEDIVSLPSRECGLKLCTQFERN